MSDAPPDPRNASASSVATETHPSPEAATGVGNAPGTVPELTAGSGTGDLRQASLWSDAWRQLRKNTLFLIASAMLLVLTVMSIAPQLFTSIDPRARGACQLGDSRQGPGTNGAWFGYDTFGCDYYSTVIYGARVSMIIGLVVVGGSMLIGVFLGALAGYFGGWFDTVIARITDVIYGLPTILGAILLLQLLASPRFFGERNLATVSIALILLGWLTFMRLFRSSVISIKETDYVSAARAMGASNSRIILKHIVPNGLAPVLVYGTIAVGGIIAAEATLSFLGIGLQQPAISWGLQINSAQNYIRSSPHLLFFPSVFLSVTVLSFILLGDALRDALDPKLR
ncbi:MAG: transporter permease [Frankiales bacterium]|jgi:oligopeptide transport system permease protein|nr:transporter permease [Frankiales bacterium]